MYTFHTPLFYYKPITCRQQGNASKEVREGVTYSEGINFEDLHPSEVQEIPPPSHQPSLQPVPFKEFESLDQVIFDIEATGLGTCILKTRFILYSCIFFLAHLS
jgi:hypothetical protein